MPPFIVLDVTSGKFQGKGLYDPGSNASAISSDALKRLENSLFVPCKGKFDTVNGEGHTLGITFIPLKIFNITQKVVVYVLDSKFCKYDFIIGLDLIPTFKLGLDHTLKISQISNVGIKPSYNKLDVYQYDFHAKVSHLDDVKSNEIQSLLRENSKAFAKHAFDVGNITNYECSIPLSCDTYITKKPYRCSYQDRQEIENQVSQLLKHGIITESNSPYASPVTLQFKKVGATGQKQKKRMCVDYRDLNKVIVPESYPFPLIDEIITQTRGHTWFSALDINAAFWSIPITEQDRHKTAFVTQSGHYEWRTLPFGMKNSPAIFQRVLSGILRRRGLCSFSINYLDDILVYSNSFEEHVSHLRSLINALYEEGFRLNFDKCKFAASSLPYLGHIISTDSVKPLQENLAAIDAFPIPCSRKNVRQFLGKVNFYRKFIPRSTILLEPFHALLRKNVPFQWTSECQASFEKVKLLLTSEPILAVYDRTRPIFIYTDASAVGIGAVLKQEQSDGSLKPVACFSKKLSKSQGKRKSIYLESLATGDFG